MKIKLNKFVSNLIPPMRMHYDDAGVDCFAQEDFELKNEAIINLGFGLEIPNGYVGLLLPRSSMNAKNIITPVGTIDSGYRGEIKAKFINHGDLQKFKRGERICQIVILPIAICEFTQYLGNERGVNGFGSTGK